MLWLPRDFVGSVLLNAGRQEDFERWGKELLAYALVQVGQCPFAPIFSGVSTYTLDKEGSVDHRSFKIADSRRQWLQGPSTVFGEDAAPASGADLDEFERMWRRGRESWLQDLKRLEAWEGCDLNDFSARRALKSWRQLFQSEFLTFARSFLNGTASANPPVFHLSCFVDAVLCNLLALAPQDALQWCERLQRLPFKVSTYYNVSSFIAALWDTTDCHLREHSALRAQLFRDANDDE